MSSDQPAAKRPKIRIFNPHRLNPDELEKSFIARQDLFRSLLSEILDEPPNGAPQHHLIIGQRGMGKTTLLRRLALELHREPYSPRFLPLSFPEEQYIEVDRLSKFWLNCLDSMADSLEHEGEHDAARELDEAVSRLLQHKTDETTYQEECRTVFTAAWQKLKRRPVLFLDNFNLLLGKLRKEDFALRGYFSSPGAPVLVAASAVYPQELTDYGAAFYDGFKSYYLYPLTLEEVRDVLLRLAQLVERPGLVDRIYQEMPRLAALRDLTGGNPRTAVLLFELFSDGFSEDAFEDLDALLDLVTPLYQSRLDQLSELAQTIVGTLARHWSPMTKADIVSEARLVDSSVSPQLGRLRDIGLVEETTVFPGKKTGYQIAERFFNIWYLMRFSSRRQRASLECLTRFLEEFHTPDQRSRSARELLRRERLSRGNITYAMALAGSLADEPALARELEWKAQLELIQQMDGVRERIAAILDPDEIHPRVFSFADLKRRLESVVPSDSPVDGHRFAELVLGSPALVPGGRGKATRYNRTSLTAKRLTSSELASLLIEFETETRELSERFSPEAVRWIQARLYAGTITSWNDPEGLDAIILLTEDPQVLRLIREFGHSEAKHKLHASAVNKLIDTLQLRPSADAESMELDTWGETLVEFGQFEQAEEAFRTAIAIDPTNAWAWCHFGRLSTEHLRNHVEAETAFRAAVQADPENSWAWDYLGRLLTENLGRHAEAEQIYREAIQTSQPNAWLWFDLSQLLSLHFGRYAEAIEGLRKAIQLSPHNPWNWLYLGDILQHKLNDHHGAYSSYREAVQIDPSIPRAWEELAHLADYELGQPIQAAEAYRRVQELEPENNAIRYRLACLLRDVLGQPEEARTVGAQLTSEDGRSVLPALDATLAAAWAGDWNTAEQELRSSLPTIERYQKFDHHSVWHHLSAVLLHLRFGEQFVKLLDDVGADVTLLPWFGAVQAHALGDRRHLLNLPVEARTAAEQIFDDIAKRRQQLAPYKAPT